MQEQVPASPEPTLILLTTGQAAKRLGVNARTVIRWIDIGYAKGFRLPNSKHRRITVEEVERLMRIVQRGS